MVYNVMEEIIRERHPEYTTDQVELEILKVFNYSKPEPIANRGFSHDRGLIYGGFYQRKKTERV